MWNTVLSQSFTDRLCCGLNEKWWIMGRSRDQFGPEGPEVSTSATCRSPAARDQAKGRRVAGDPNLKLEAPRGTDSSQTPRWRKPDSNHRSRVTRPSFSTPAHVTCLTPCTRKSRREREPILRGCRPPPAEPMVRIGHEPHGQNRTRSRPEPKVRIQLSPAESPQTFGSAKPTTSNRSKSSISSRH